MGTEIICGPSVRSLWGDTEGQLIGAYSRLQDALWKLSSCMEARHSLLQKQRVVRRMKTKILRWRESSVGAHKSLCLFIILLRVRNAGVKDQKVKKMKAAIRTIRKPKRIKKRLLL